AMIFQDPRAHINPVRTIGDFLTEGLRTNLGMRAGAARREAVGLLAEVGIDDGERRLRQYPHELSGGLLQRVMIASALAGRPRLILADEPTTALDVTRQAEVVAILDRLRRERGLGLLFITHDLDLATAICDRVSVMYAGSIVESRTAADLYARPRHPYTAALLGARPSIEARVARLPVVPGRPISAFEAPPGCAFGNRCPCAEDACHTDAQRLRVLDGGAVRCRRAGQPGVPATLIPSPAAAAKEIPS
ncbi:ABC transporter ATP-binding protein, partial [Streptomyces sp. SID3343]|uniref:ABC transporter ATP-binding protein n=1 Tax=Streptomyces sp. SID3343 TaxID=2690260 RepID=UPI0013706814